MVKVFHYDDIKVVLKHLDINPIEFKNAAEGKTTGWFPNESERKGKAAPLVKLLWGKKGWFK